jgi:hypothetical protein
MSGTPGQWRRFDADWKIVLGRHHAAALHTKDAIARGELISECVGVIEQHMALPLGGAVPPREGLLPFTVTIVLDDFNRARGRQFNSTDRPPPLRHRARTSRRSAGHTLVEMPAVFAAFHLLSLPPVADDARSKALCNSRQSSGRHGRRGEDSKQNLMPRVGNVVNLMKGTLPNLGMKSVCTGPPRRTGFRSTSQQEGQFGYLSRQYSPSAKTSSPKSTIRLASSSYRFNFGFLLRRLQALAER